MVGVVVVVADVAAWHLRSSSALCTLQHLLLLLAHRVQNICNASDAAAVIVVMVVIMCQSMSACNVGGMWGVGQRGGWVVLSFCIVFCLFSLSKDKITIFLLFFFFFFGFLVSDIGYSIQKFKYLSTETHSLATHPGRFVFHVMRRWMLTIMSNIIAPKYVIVHHRCNGVVNICRLGCNVTFREKKL